MGAMRLSIRIPTQLRASIAWYAQTTGLAHSEAIRDLLARGLVQDRSREAGYRAGYAAGRTAAYADLMRAAAIATKGTPR